MMDGSERPSKKARTGNEGVNIKFDHSVPDADADVNGISRLSQDDGGVAANMSQGRRQVTVRSMRRL